MIKTRKSLFLYFAAIVAFFLYSQEGYTQCNNVDVEISSVDPPIPPSGSYEPGVTIELCLDITYSAGADWISAIVYNLPDGWDLDEFSSNPPPPPPACANGVWLWFDSNPCPCELDNSGPGWYYDSSINGPLDGNPCNNWGAACLSGAASSFTYCVEIPLDADCGGPGNPYNGQTLAPSITLYGDQEVGNWSGGPCSTDPPCPAPIFAPAFPATLDCCDAEPGTAPTDPVNICGTTPFSLFDYITPPYDTPGIWTGPAGWSVDGNGDPMFDPNTDVPGEYTYTVTGTDGCTSSATITMQYINLGQQAIAGYCNSTPVCLLNPSSPGTDVWNNPNFTPNAGGTWTDPNGNVLAGCIVDPLTAPSGLYEYEYFDINGCRTFVSMDVSFAAGATIGNSAVSIEVCLTDGNFTPFDSLGNAFPGGNWTYWNNSGGFLGFYIQDQVSINPLDYNGATNPVLPLVDGYLVYNILVPPCPLTQDTVFIDAGTDFNAGLFTEATICAGDPTINLVTLLDGTPSSGGLWEDENGNPFPNPLTPSSVPADSTYTLIYSGGFEGTSCYDQQVFLLTILDDNINAGDPNTITVCAGDPPFEMVDELGGNPQVGGDWTLNGQPVQDFFVPSTMSAGNYVYTLTTPCGTDSETLTINVTPIADSGLDGTLAVCDNATNVDLFSGLGGTPETNGTWAPFGPLVNGATLNDGDVFTYTVGAGNCQSSSTVTIDLLQAPDPGVLTTVPQQFCATDAPFAMNSLFTTNPSDLNGAYWSGPAGYSGGTLDPSTGTSGLYTYTIPDNGCGSVSVSLNITINTLPNAGISNTTTLCESLGTVNLISHLQGTPQGGGQWFDAANNPIGNSFNISGSCGSALDFTYEVTNGSCTASSNLTINVECAPNAGPDSTVSRCADGTILALNTIVSPSADAGNFGQPTVVLNAANSGNYTYTVAGVSCPADQAIYTLNITNQISATSVNANCQPNQTEYTVTIVLSGGVPPYTVNGNPIVGNTFTSAILPIAGNPTYSFAIDDNGPCPAINVTGAAPNCVCPADVTFADPSVTICEGETAQLELIFPGGTDPYTVDGTNIPANGGLQSGDAISVTPAVTTTYTITSVTDANCTSTVNRQITVVVEEQPNAGIDVTEDLCGTGGNLNLTTLLDPSADTGGNFFGPAPSTNQVPGNLISQVAASSGVYTYVVSGNVCPDDQATYTINIDSPIAASNITATCTPSQLEYIVSFNISGGDGDYTVTLNGVSYPGIAGSFTSNPINLASNPTYSFSISDDSGNCADFSSIIYNAPNCVCPADAEFTTPDLTICEGETAQLELIFPWGTGPFSVSGTNIPANGGLQSGDAISVTPAVTTTYTITSVTDANCTSTVSSQITVVVEEQPNAGIDVTEDLCGTGGNLNLTTLLDPSADTGGNFFGPAPSTNQVPGNLISQVAASSGVYTYVVSGNVCPDDQATYTINISAPINVTGISAICTPAQDEYVVSFTIAGGDGDYTVQLNGDTYTSVGASFTSNPLSLTGNPTYSFTVSDDSGICANFVSGTSNAPNCTCPADAEFVGPNSITICEGETAQLELNFPGGTDPYSVSGTNIPANSNLQSGDVLSVSPAITTTYTITSVTDLNCTQSVNDQITVVVENQLNAGVDVTEDLCGTGGTLNLSTLLDPSADTGGNFFGPAPSTNQVPGNSLSLVAASSGVYTYVVAGNVCPDDQATYTININAPINVTGISAICTPAQDEYVVSFTISGGDGDYTVQLNGDTYTSVGSSFTSNPQSLAGNPTYSITVSDDTNICPDFVSGPTNAPNCACPADVEFVESSLTICQGETAQLELIFPGGSGLFTVSGTNIPPNNGLQPGDALSVAPTVTTTYTITSVTDDNCTQSVNEPITVFVDMPANAGPDVSEVFCQTGAPLNLGTLVPAPPIGTFVNQATGNAVPNNTIVQSAANSGTYIHEVTNGVCPTDQAIYNITIYPVLGISAQDVVCTPSQTGYIVSFQITGGDGNYTITDTENGNTIGGQIISNNPAVWESEEIPNGLNFGFSVSDGSGCSPVSFSGVDPDCDCPAAASISGSTSICEGECAQIVFDLAGDGPFTVTYQNSSLPPGQNQVTLNNITDGYVLTACLDESTTYTLVSVSDQNCSGQVSGPPVVIGVDPPLVVSGVNETYDDTYENYTVSFQISGGIPGTYQVSPFGGTISGGIYTSAPIPCGQEYNFTVSDNGACPNVNVSGVLECTCVSEAGTITNGLVEVCENEILTIPYNNNEVLDGNDNLIFVLHDGDENSVGTIFATSTDGNFDYIASLDVNTIFYVTAIAGNIDGFGNVDLNHPCTDYSNGVPVIFNSIPVATITGGGTVCPGEEVELIVELSGEAPFNFEVTPDFGVSTIPDEVMDNQFSIIATNPGVYTVTQISDDNCTGISVGQAVVNNFEVPTAELSGDPEVCENSGNGPILEFTGTPPFDYTYSINGDLLNDTLTSNSSTVMIAAEEDGTYVVESISDANCTGTVTGSLDVTILDRPTATITGGGVICEGGEADFNLALTGQGPWSVQYTVDGVPQGSFQVNQSPYSFESDEQGEYEILTVSDQNCNGLQFVNDAELIVNPLPTVEIIPSTEQVCFGQELELIYDLQGNPPFEVTYVLNEDTITLSGVGTDFFQILQPEQAVYTEVLYIEDGSNPTCSNIPDASELITVGQLPNAPELESDTICAGSGPIAIGVPADEDLDYSWSPADRLSDANSSNPSFELETALPFIKTYQYVLTATNGDCFATDTMTITVDPGPRARFEYTPDPVNSEDPFVQFMNTTITEQEALFMWQFDSLGTSTEENPRFEFPEGVVANYEVILTAIDPLTGCLDEYREIISIKPEMLIFVPNAFTPDGDGLNDLWGPVLRNIDENDYKLSVFDRFGNLVFVTRDPNQKWNGNDSGNEHYVRADVYVWMIETKNTLSLEEVTFRGDVTVIR